MRNTFVIGILTIIIIASFISIIFDITSGLLSFFLGLIAFLCVLGIFSIQSRD